MRRILSLAAIAVLAAPVAAYAATLNVPVDQVRKLNYSGAAFTVVVGNPAIADVTVVDQRTVVVMGKRQGLTNIVILDRNGRTLFNDDILVAESDQSAVSISRGRSTAYYACAPYCAQVGGERPSTQTPVPAASGNQVVTTVSATPAAPTPVVSQPVLLQ